MTFANFADLDLRPGDIVRLGRGLGNEARLKKNAAILAFRKRGQFAETEIP